MPFLFKYMNFIALDLELNNTQENIDNPKVIQVGICIGNINEILLTKGWYIDPNERIYDYIVNLTGIDDNIIKNKSSDVEQIANEISQLITIHNCFVNPVTWGAGDVPKLLSTFQDKSISFQHFGRRELDVKQIYSFLMIAQNRNVKGGLSSAMGRFGLPFRGKPHRAEIDAENTLRFFFELTKRQEKLEHILNLCK